MARKKVEGIVEELEKEAKAEIKEATKKKLNPESRNNDGTGNLIPFDKLTEDRQREIRSMGGKASGAKKRKQKELRELTQTFLQQDAVGAVKSNLQRLGFQADDMTNLAAILGVLFTKVLNNADLNAARTIIEWSGMSPMQQIQENEAMQKLAMIMGAPEEKEEAEDVVFYIPDNGRDDVEVIIDEGEKI